MSLDGSAIRKSESNEHIIGSAYDDKDMTAEAEDINSILGDIETTTVKQTSDQQKISAFFKKFEAMRQAKLAEQEKQNNFDEDYGLDDMLADYDDEKNITQSKNQGFRP